MKGLLCRSCHCEGRKLSSIESDLLRPEGNPLVVGDPLSGFELRTSTLVYIPCNDRLVRSGYIYIYIVAII